jgi:hypothetical protein
MEPNCQDNSGTGLLWGAGIVTTIAVAHNASKNQQHQQEIAERDATIYKLIETIKKQDNDLFVKNILLATKDSTIARLNTDLAAEKLEHSKTKVQLAQSEQSVAELAATVKGQQLQMMATIFPEDEGGNNN